MDTGFLIWRPVVTMLAPADVYGFYGAWIHDEQTPGI